ncbi:hypothetical protein BDV38DRAFT_277661 [Aspergillus pseudotamarii]|uniref:Uncharacterized protein n=1 Tax=Aspergillus pseudotamarii TaxID=132259 RepID=A0A5N6T9J5_ASPPS|nr:uncharacterized protein BDV38DRAFT_277661 [Aspergillus pseudotamarii]KAE8142849.1 hypothetical protein BDV38DRAFT_277661 [Aspergillus pseudotamarii]
MPASENIEMITDLLEGLKHGVKAINHVFEVGKCANKCYRSLKDTKRKSRDRENQTHETHRRQSKPHNPHSKTFYVLVPYETHQVTRFDREDARKVALNAFKGNTARLISPKGASDKQPTSLYEGYVLARVKVEKGYTNDDILKSVRESLRTKEGCANLEFYFRELRRCRRGYYVVSKRAVDARAQKGMKYNGTESR